MSVAQMSCESVPVSFFDYENTTSPRMADILDCLVDKKVVCSPVTSTKCADVTYTKCEEVRMSSALSKTNILRLTRQGNLFSFLDSLFSRELCLPCFQGPSNQLFQHRHPRTITGQAAQAVVSV